MKRRVNSDNASSNIDDLLDQVAKETNNKRQVTYKRIPDPETHYIPPQQMYAIFRGNARVSESEYPGKFEAMSSSEYQHWNNILAKFPDGSRLEVLPV